MNVFRNVRDDERAKRFLPKLSLPKCRVPPRAVPPARISVPRAGHAHARDAVRAVDLHAGTCVRMIAQHFEPRRFARGDRHDAHARDVGVQIEPRMFREWKRPTRLLAPRLALAAPSRLAVAVMGGFVMTVTMMMFSHDFFLRSRLAASDAEISLRESAPSTSSTLLGAATRVGEPNASTTCSSRATTVG